MWIVNEFLNKYLTYLRWGILFLSWIGVAWSVHHIDVLSDKAALADHTQNIAESIPKVITVTQTITKVIHDAHDKCADAAMPATILDELH